MNLTCFTIFDEPCQFPLLNLQNSYAVLACIMNAIQKKKLNVPKLLSGQKLYFLLANNNDKNMQE